MFKWVWVFTILVLLKRDILYNNALQFRILFRWSLNAQENQKTSIIDDLSFPTPIHLTEGGKKERNIPWDNQVITKMHFQSISEQNFIAAFNIQCLKSFDNQKMCIKYFVKKHLFFRFCNINHNKINILSYLYKKLKN